MRQRLPAGEARSEMVFSLVKPRELARLDEVVAAQGRSRSHCIREAVLAFTAEHHDPDGDHNQAAADDDRA